MPARRAAGAAARGSAAALSAGVWAARWVLWLAAGIGGSAATAGVRAALRAAWTVRVVWDLTLTLLAFLGFHSWRWGLLAGRLLAFAALLGPAWGTLLRWNACSGRVARGVRYGPHRRNDADVYAPPPGAVLCTCAASDASRRGGGGGGDDTGDTGSATAAPACTCSPARRPVVLCFCGGAWIIGYKFWPVALCRALALAGVVAVAVDYRNVPQATLSGMVQDVDAALEAVLTARAVEEAAAPPEEEGATGVPKGTASSEAAPPPPPTTLAAAIAAAGGDPSRVFVWGQSAGAHLAVTTVIERAICDTLAAAAAAAAGGGVSGGGAGRKAYAIGGSFPVAATAADDVAAGCGNNSPGRRRLASELSTPSSTTALEACDALATPPRGSYSGCSGSGGSGYGSGDHSGAYHRDGRAAAFSPPSYVPATPASPVTFSSPAADGYFHTTPVRRRGSSSSAAAAASPATDGGGGGGPLASPSHRRPHTGTRVRLVRTASSDLTEAAALAYDSELGPLGAALMGAATGEEVLPVAEEDGTGGVESVVEADGAPSFGDSGADGGGRHHHAHPLHTPRPRLAPAPPHPPHGPGSNSILSALLSSSSRGLPPLHSPWRQHHGQQQQQTDADGTASRSSDDVSNTLASSTLLAQAAASVSPSRPPAQTPSRHPFHTHHAHGSVDASFAESGATSASPYRGRLRSQAEALADGGADVVAFPAGGAFAYAALPSDDDDGDGDASDGDAEPAVEEEDAAVPGRVGSSTSTGAAADVTSASASVPATPSSAAGGSAHAVPLPPSPPLPLAPPPPPPVPHPIRRLFAVSGPYHLASVGAAIQAKAGFAPSFLDTVFEGTPDRFSPALWLPACVRAAVAAGLAQAAAVVAPAAGGAGAAPSLPADNASSPPTPSSSLLASSSLASFPPLDPARLPRMSLYHGTADTTVPHGSSVAFAAALAGAGVPPSHVSLTLLPGWGHTDPILEGPLSGGDDPLLRGMLKAIRADLRRDNDEAVVEAEAVGAGCGGGAPFTPRKQPAPTASAVVSSPALPPAATERLVPPLLVAAARWVNPF
jgi:acetyl esterase/lipase